MRWGRKKRVFPRGLRVFNSWSPRVHYWWSGIDPLNITVYGYYGRSLLYTSHPRTNVFVGYGYYSRTLLYTYFPRTNVIVGYGYYSRTLIYTAHPKTNIIIGYVPYTETAG